MNRTWRSVLLCAFVLWIGSGDPPRPFRLHATFASMDACQYYKQARYRVDDRHLLVCLPERFNPNQ